MLYFVSFCTQFLDAQQKKTRAIIIHIKYKQNLSSSIVSSGLKFE